MPKAVLIRRRVGGWLLFGVVISLVPAGFTWHHRLTAGERHDWLSIWLAGEVILVAVVFAGGSLGDLLLSLIPPAEPYRAGLVFCNAFFAVIVFGVGIYFYAEVTSSASSAFYEKNHSAALLENLVLLALGVATGASSISLRTLQELKAVEDAVERQKADSDGGRHRK